MRILLVWRMRERAERMRDRGGDPDTLQMLNALLDRLVMLEASDE